MGPFGSNSRNPSAEFERISLEDLSPSENRRQRPQIQIIPPADTNVSHPPSLSPGRPIALPRVGLRRTPTTGATSHWRRPSYSRVHSPASAQANAAATNPQYDEEGAEPDIEELKEGLNVALGTGVGVGSWLPITRQPSARRVSGLAPPQILVQDSTEETFEPDERETAGLTVNASQIAGTAPVRRARTLSPVRPRIMTSGMLGADLSAVERGPVSAVEAGSFRTSLVPGDTDRTPGGGLLRHIRKASQRVVNIASTGRVDEGTEFPFVGTSPQMTPVAQTGPTEFPFNPLDAPISPIDKLSTEFNVVETGHSPLVDTVEFRGRSVGIFEPNNAIRNRLCNILLHPYPPRHLSQCLVPRSLSSYL
jgi:hypothetical protein